MTTPTQKTILPLIPLRDLVILPSIVTPILVGRKRSIKSIDIALEGDKEVLLLPQKNSGIEAPTQADLLSVGTKAVIRQILRLPDGAVRVLLEAKERVKILRLFDESDYSCCEVEKLDDILEESDILEPLCHELKEKFDELTKITGKITKEIIANIEKLGYAYAGRLSDMVAEHIVSDVQLKQQLLEQNNVEERIKSLIKLLDAEIDKNKIDKKIKSQVKKQMNKDQKEYYLNEQMKAIQKELGDKDEVKGELQELEEKLESKNLPEHAYQRAERELKKLKMMSPMSSEATVVRNYLDWILGLPWSEKTEEKRDLKQAQDILEAEHYGLKKPKERILEYLAVHSLIEKMSGPILCLVGPPGVGKTSLARSIAHCTGREFVRIALGGVRDEAEIRGHRRTYVGALPGKIIHAIKKAGTKNPIILLDEIDKMSTDFRGDPSAALLEVLDPEQNNSFNDHYLDLDFDLSEVIFITTANNRHQIPLPLQDRLEMLEVSGYTEVEKLNIIKFHMLKKQEERHGIDKANIQWTDPALYLLINRYTRESGVRSLERQVASLCRKIAREVIKFKEKGNALEAYHLRVDQKVVQRLLGPPPYSYGVTELDDERGLVNGLAYTSWGGNLLQTECTVMAGKGKMTITGKLGEVMQESAQAAMSYVRSKAVDLGLPPMFYQDIDIHMHFPEGAIPKDGPSAGVTMATALVSALCKYKVRKDVAMTGEITLRGRVLPIGGLKEKLLAAKRGGIKTVFVPKENDKDLLEVPPSIVNALEVVLVEQVDQIWEKALLHDGKLWKNVEAQKPAQEEVSIDIASLPMAESTDQKPASVNATTRKRSAKPADIQANQPAVNKTIVEPKAKPKSSAKGVKTAEVETATTPKAATSKATTSKATIVDSSTASKVTPKSTRSKKS